MSNLVKHAEKELTLINEDQDFAQDLLDIIAVFSSQGHSGFSAAASISKLNRLLGFKPLSPLTGEPNEWVDVHTDEEGNITYQNSRCSGVFKQVDKKGRLVYCHDVNSVVVEDEDGSRWVSGKAPLPRVTFPYTPPDEPNVILREELK